MTLDMASSPTNKPLEALMVALAGALSLSIASAVLLVCFRVSSSWLVLGGALAGLALRG